MARGWGTTVPGCVVEGVSQDKGVDDAAPNRTWGGGEGVAREGQAAPADDMWGVSRQPQSVRFDPQGHSMGQA